MTNQYETAFDAAAEAALEERLSAAADLPRTSYVAQQLAEKAKLFEERHAIYGDNYLRFGPIMALLLKGQTLDPANARDMARLGVFTQVVSKIIRYGENFSRGGHDDSLDDISVYAMMLKQIDSKKA